MANKIKLRNDTAAQWASENPVLLLGEVGLETDTRKLKVGDGTTAWSSRPYFNNDGVWKADSVSASVVEGELTHDPSWQDSLILVEMGGGDASFYLPEAVEGARFALSLDGYTLNISGLLFYLSGLNAVSITSTEGLCVFTAIGGAWWVSPGVVSSVVEETTTSLLEKLQGDAEDATRIGAEYLPDSLVKYNTDRTVIVDPKGTDTERGVAFVAAYSAAKLLTPGGLALSETNRATVLLPPGSYLLSTFMTLDADFVDITAITPETPCLPSENEVHTLNGLADAAYYKPQRVVIYSTSDAHLIRQACRDTRLTGFTLAQLCQTAATSRYALYIVSTTTEANDKSVYDRMYFYSAYIHYAVNLGVAGVGFALNGDGTWLNCVSGTVTWRLRAATTCVLRCKMFDCQFGPRSVGGDTAAGSITSARFERCKVVGAVSGATRGEAFGGCTTFGMAITSEAVFVECDGGDRSYALGKANAGTFIRCRGGDRAFGSTQNVVYKGTFSGYAEDCVSGPNSFGGTASAGNGKCTGTLVRCIILGNTIAMRLEGAKIRDSRITNIVTGVNVVEILDSNSVISNTDLIAYQGGAGVPIYAASAFNVAAYHCRMNNATNDADGLGSNVTNLVSSSGNVVSDYVA